MTKLIIFLAKKFKRFDDYFTQIVFTYLAFKKDENINTIDLKKLAEKKAQEDLKKIVAYEKLGVLSGFGKPIIIRAGRK